MEENELNLPDDFDYSLEDESEDGLPDPQEETEFEDADYTNEAEQTEATQDIEPFLKVKYNHEERALSQEEAVMLAQKGMNYDKLTEKLNQYENHAGLNYIQDLASRNGMTVEDLVGYWKGQEEESALNELIQQNIPEEYALEMLESRKFREAQQQKQQQEQAKEAQNKEFKEFFEMFPDAKPEDIPAEVWQINSQGIPLKYAFMEHKYKNVNTQNQILRKNQENKKKAPGLGVTSHGSADPGKGDPFLDGFNFED